MIGLGQTPLGAALLAPSGESIVSAIWARVGLNPQGWRIGLTHDTAQ
ncbi:MAG: hypothetical protein ACTSYE_06145 [Alphaproteobacteria bacterium]